VLRLVSDVNFSGPIVQGLLLRLPELDLVRAQDEGMSRTEDPDVLSWAATQDRVVLTHDVQTMVGFAYERVARRLPMPGAFVVHQNSPIGAAIEEILMLVLCSFDREWDNQVVFIPL